MKRSSRYWHYKCNIDGGPAGWSGEWETMVFNDATAKEWGGHYSTQSPEVWNYIDNDVRVGDGVIAYQTDKQAIIGTCEITRISGGVGDRRLWLKPVHRFSAPLKILDLKGGTTLAENPAIKGRVMMKPIDAGDVDQILGLAGVVAQGGAGATKQARSKRNPLSRKRLCKKCRTYKSSAGTCLCD